MHEQADRQTDKQAEQKNKSMPLQCALPALPLELVLAFLPDGEAKAADLVLDF